MIIPMPISFVGSKMNTFVKKHGFGIIGKLDVNQYNFPYTFNQTSAMICELFVSHHFSRAFHYTEKLNYMPDQEPCSSCWLTYSGYCSYTV